MKLVASLIVAEVEVDRYLLPCVEHLLEFCDEVVVATDRWESSARPGRLTNRWGAKAPVLVMPNPGPSLFEHEGHARQALLELTLGRGPTHVLAIDADEFVADGAAVRAACSDPGPAVWDLCMQEVWNADDDGLELRQDGGWAEHDVGILWRVPSPPQALFLPDRALASGRVPTVVSAAPVGFHGHTGTAILHFGWANQAERVSRHARYVEHDGGRYHASAHLDSILLPDEAITLTGRPWPAGFTNRRIQAILDHAGVT